jgi:predicted nucleotidyltransferase
MMKLHGTNKIEDFRRLAESLKSKIASYKGVSGIVFMGGLTRGFADKYSDVDVVVLLGERDERLRKKIGTIGLEEKKSSGVDVDLEVHFLEDFQRRKWNEMDRWDFSSAEIVFDPDRKIHEIFRKRLTVSDGYWLKHIVVYGEYVRWYCCPLAGQIGCIAETWIDRGDLVSAHYCLNYSLSLIISALFALNKEFLPPPKWMIFCSYELKWLPADYKKLIREAMTARSLSRTELKRRLRALRALWMGILPKIKEEMCLTPELISRLYVKQMIEKN